MYLCCQINNNNTCTNCKKKVCDQHIYKDSGWSSKKIISGVCTDCYISVREKHIMTAASREGMTFKQLYLAARKIMPTAYLSVTVSIEDHEPGMRNPAYKWNIYSSGYGHTEADSPEEVLFSFERKVKGVGVTTDEQIDI